VDLSSPNSLGMSFFSIRLPKTKSGGKGRRRRRRRRRRLISLTPSPKESGPGGMVLTRR